MSISCCSVSAFSTHRSSTAISTTDTCPYQIRIPFSVSLKMRLGGRQVDTGHPQVRGTPQGLGPFLPAADMPIAKHRCLLYLPRARHCERAPGHANRTDTICRPEDVVLVNNNVHYAGGKLAIVQGPRIHTYSVKTGLAPYQSSSLVLYFLSCNQSLFSPSQLHLGRCCILLRRDVVQHHDIPSLQMKAVYMFQCIFSL